MNDKIKGMVDKLKDVMVDGFNLSEFFVELDNEVKIPLEISILCFRLKYPEGRIISKLVEDNDSFVIYETKVYADRNDSEGTYLANSFGVEPKEQGSINCYERAETKAIDTALTLVGVGFHSKSTLQPNNENDKLQSNQAESIQKSLSKRYQEQVTSPQDEHTAPQEESETPPQDEHTAPQEESENNNEQEYNSCEQTVNLNISNDMSIEEIRNRLSLDDALSVKLSSGFGKGMELKNFDFKGKHSSLLKYITRMPKNDNILKAAAYVIAEHYGINIA